jgi:hypothetical protein
MGPDLLSCFLYYYPKLPFKSLTLDLYCLVPASFWCTFLLILYLAPPSANGSNTSLFTVLYIILTGLQNSLPRMPYGKGGAFTFLLFCLLLSQTEAENRGFHACLQASHTLWVESKCGWAGDAYLALKAWAPARRACWHDFLPEMIPVLLCRIPLMDRVGGGGGKCLPSGNIHQLASFLCCLFPSFSYTFLQILLFPFTDWLAFSLFHPSHLSNQGHDLMKQLQLPSSPFLSSCVFLLTSLLGSCIQYALYVFSFYTV